MCNHARPDHKAVSDCESYNGLKEWPGTGKKDYEGTTKEIVIEDEVLLSKTV